MKEKSQAAWWILGTIVFIALVASWMAFMPKYRVWSREMGGRAELAEATWNRQIAVQEAEARAESAKLDAQAEIERAKGAAESQKIISETLSREYLQYLWIQKVEGGDNKQTIYVPSENGLPLLEASRLAK